MQSINNQQLTFNQTSKPSIIHLSWIILHDCFWTT